MGVRRLIRSSTPQTSGCIRGVLKQGCLQKLGPHNTFTRWSIKLERVGYNSACSYKLRPYQRLERVARVQVAHNKFVHSAYIVLDILLVAYREATNISRSTLFQLHIEKQQTFALFSDFTDCGSVEFRKIRLDAVLCKGDIYSANNVHLIRRTSGFNLYLYSYLRL